MKAKNLFLLLLLGLPILGCNKDPFDFRSKYIGDYSFIINYSSWNPINGYIDTTYSIDGNINYGPDKNSILILYSGGYISKEFTIFEDGTIDGNGCTGEFETVNKIKYSCYWASPAAHSIENVSGGKK